jgi:hypothetical protein
MHCEGGQMSGGMYCEGWPIQEGCIVRVGRFRRDVV